MLLKPAFNGRSEQRIVFINAVGFTMFITFDIVFMGVVRKRRVGHTMALSWGLLSVLIFGTVEAEGWISQKRTFLARNK